MGGAITLVWVDQARMTPAMAADFRAMAAEFRRVWGVDLLGTSGIRLDSEQERIFRERYVPNSQVNGRRVYDRRWWNGVLWARISSAGTVAVPGSSNHQLGYGRRGAVDLRDGGSDPGVTRFGTRRNLWLRANAWRWGFNPDEGVAVNEAWHYRYTRDPYRAAPLPPVVKPPTPPAPPKPKPVPEPTTLGDIMAFKSIAIGYRPDPDEDRIIATALDWEDGTKSDAIVKKDYGTSFYGKLTEGGFTIITEGHYKDVLAEFDAAVKAKREHELAVARASAGA